LVILMARTGDSATQCFRDVEVSKGFRFKVRLREWLPDCVHECSSGNWPMTALSRVTSFRLC
jgi:hypothetical protein